MRELIRNSKFSKLYKYCILLSFFFLAGEKAYAEFNPDAYLFSYITYEDGMAQNTIDYIYKDSRGFMWFATWNGLNRYDGYEFIRYDTQSERNAINSLFVCTLVEDDFQQLWVGTEEGVNVIDIFSGDVLTIEHSGFSDHAIFSASINTLLKDSKGRIWIGFNGGLAIVSLSREGNIMAIDMLQQDASVNIYSLYEDVSGSVWVGYANAVKMVTALSDKVIHFESAPGTLSDVSFDVVFDFFQDGENMWIATGLGLYCYNLETKTHKRYENDPHNPRSLIQNYVKDIIRDHDGNLFFATFRGLSVYNPETDDFTNIENIPEIPYSLNNNFVNSLYIDSQGVIWIGTEKGGINKMTKKEVMFSFYRHDPKQPFSLSPYPVNAIYEDSNKNLWIGTVEGGLNKRIDTSGKFIHYKNQQNNPYALPHNVVSVITEGNGYLWIGSWGGGVSFMKLSEEGRFYKLEDRIKSGNYDCIFISDIIYDSNLHALWIAARSGLYYYDIERDKITSVLFRNSRLELASSLLLDTSGRLWVGSEYGLFCIYVGQSDVMQGQFAIEPCRLTSKERKAPLHEKVACVFESKDSTIWVGSNGNTLYKLLGRDDNEYVFKNYGTEVGFSDNMIYAIEEDAQGYLWLSTNMGLSYFCPERERAKTFYASDGLSTNQFYWSASCHLSDGKLLFGNVDGVVLFDPSGIEPDTVHLKVSIVGGKLYNDPVDYWKMMDEWRLHEKDKSFSIEFSSLYYTAPEKIKYMYMLEGFDTDWIEVNANRRFANYTNLPAGKYVFKVRSTNPGGEWSDHITSLPIRVVPPFYKHTSFIALLLFLIILLVYYVNEMRIRNLRRQKQRLEVMVEERTHEIEQQKDELAKQTKDLAEANDKLNQATQDKINFFTNITHEFKTPLTLVLGPVEQAIKLAKDSKVVELLKLARKNSNFLLSLINQLMDFRKVDSDTMKVNKIAADFEEFAHSIVQPFHVLCKGRNISIEETYSLSYRIFRFDSDLMQKILVNLLSNAIKYTPDNGSIRIYATIFLNEVNGSKELSLSIEDSGPGIPDSLKDNIFDKFYQIENQIVYPVYGQSGTGIGLFLCKQIVEFLQGTIIVEDSELGGASFHILFPLDKSDLEVGTFFKEESSTMESDHLLKEELPDVEEQSKPILMIVEDNPDMRAFIKSVLEERFYIIEAENGEIAMEKTLKYLPDFIVSDIMMQKMDGLEFCRKIKNNFTTSHIPVLLLTAKSSTDIRIEGYKSGADGYISKPFDAELLVARITNIMEGKSRLHKAFDSSLDVRSLEIQEESQDKKFVDKLMDVIRDNYQDPSFDVAELIEKMHVSKSLLHKKLQSLIGQSAVKIIRSYRLAKAKELMDADTSGQMNISEVAYSVGFNDPKYFTRCFTKQFGIAPSNYNKN